MAEILEGVVYLDPHFLAMKLADVLRGAPHTDFDVVFANAQNVPEGLTGDRGVEVGRVSLGNFGGWNALADRNLSMYELRILR